MKTLIAGLMALLLSGCTTIIIYKSDGTVSSGERSVAQGDPNASVPKDSLLDDLGDNSHLLDKLLPNTKWWTKLNPWKDVDEGDDTVDPDAVLRQQLIDEIRGRIDESE